MDLKRYPADWPAISRAIRKRSGGQCECEGECGRHAGRCPARQGDPLRSAIRFVVLTCAHLWRGPCADHDAAGLKCGDPEHLKAMCQACHLTYDRPHHVRNARRTRFLRRASGDLFGVDGE